MWIEKKLKNWDDFNSFVQEHEPKSWIYRGQADIRWPLKSSFHRTIEFIKTIKINAGSGNHPLRDTYETELIQLFKSQSHLYNNLNPDEDWSVFTSDSINDDIEYIQKKIEWLSIMQHYGAPTRLLDWTFSAYIAAFFANENSTTESCVYALNQSKIMKLNVKIFGKSYIKNIFNNLKESESFVYAFEPKLKNERIVRQQGLFLIPSNNFETFDKILESYDLSKSDEIGYKLIFSNKSRFHVLRTLRRMNVSNETLFPGIDGFCKSLKIFLLESNINLKRLK